MYNICDSLAIIPDIIRIWLLYYYNNYSIQVYLIKVERYFMARYELSKINKVRTFGANINFKTRLHLFSVIAKTRDLERGKFDWSGVYIQCRDIK